LNSIKSKHNIALLIKAKYKHIHVIFTPVTGYIEAFVGIMEKTWDNRGHRSFSSDLPLNYLRAASGYMHTCMQCKTLKALGAKIMNIHPAAVVV
jgi:hypothetical protein